MEHNASPLQYTQNYNGDYSLNINITTNLVNELKHNQFISYNDWVIDVDWNH